MLEAVETVIMADFDLTDDFCRTIMPWWHNWSTNFAWDVSLFRGCGIFLRYLYVPFHQSGA